MYIWLNYPSCKINFTYMKAACIKCYD